MLLFFLNLFGVVADGDGGSPYPYFPSTEHYLKPAQSSADFIDLVNLDGWTVDLVAARRNGFADHFNSRLGVGPIESVGHFGQVVGLDEMLHATAQHFTTGHALNGAGYAWVIWELSLGAEILGNATLYLKHVRARWPDAQCITAGAFGLAWRAAHPAGNTWNYDLVSTGSGIGGSDADKEIRWLVNGQFRLALLRNTSGDAGPGLVIDFTRFDYPAREPTELTRSWNLLNAAPGHPNQKQARPGGLDTPRPLAALLAEDRAIIAAVYPWLFPAVQDTV